MTAETRKQYHPSNTLYQGECRDFEQAMELWKAEHLLEFGRPLPGETEETATHYQHLAKAEQARANRALAIYHAVIKTAHAEIAATLRENDMSEFADALETGDYSTLAI